MSKNEVKEGVKEKSRRANIVENQRHLFQHHIGRHSAMGGFRSNAYTPMLKASRDHIDDELVEVLPANLIETIRSVDVPPDPWDDFYSHCEKSWKFQHRHSRKSWDK